MELLNDAFTNALLVFYRYLGGNFFIAIAVLTVIIRLATLPLSLRQQRASMKMQAVQPQVQAIQKKYRDNPSKMQEEFRKIGYKPAESLMGCLPLLIQFPILIALYQAILRLLGSTPQSLLELSSSVYGWVDNLVSLPSLLPISNKFLWLNLAQPDAIYILPILVFATTYLQTKLFSPTPQPKTGDKKKAADENPMAGMTQSMTYTMPIMFGFISLSFPAGLSIYYVISNVLGIAQSAYLRRNMDKEKAAAAQITANNVEAVAETTQATAPEATSKNGQPPKGAATKSTPAKSGAAKSTAPKNSAARPTQRKRRPAKR